MHFVHHLRICGGCCFDRGIIRRGRGSTMDYVERISDPMFVPVIRSKVPQFVPNRKIGLGKSRVQTFSRSAEDQPPGSCSCATRLSPPPPSSILVINQDRGALMTSTYLYRSRSTYDFPLSFQNLYHNWPGGHTTEGELVVPGFQACSTESFGTTCDNSSKSLFVWSYENDAL